jgi:hypothetical protein
MESNQKNVLVNRIVSFLVGGVLVFAVMSFTVVRNARSENVGLTSALDSSRYEAGRLLADAEAELDAREYEAARASLEALFANQPGSEESVQGRLLLVTVNDRERNADARWEDALPESGRAGARRWLRNCEPKPTPCTPTRYRGLTQRFWKRGAGRKLKFDPRSKTRRRIRSPR